MKTTIHADGSLHIVFNNVEKVQLFDTLQIHTVSKESTHPLPAAKLLIQLHTNGRAFVKDVFNKYKFSEFRVKELDNFRFQHRIMKPWTTFDTLCERGVMSKQRIKGKKIANTYKFIVDISNH